MLSDRPFRFTLPVEVRFRDLDALGHVNNAVYLTYLESARMEKEVELVASESARDALLQAAGLLTTVQAHLVGAVSTLAARAKVESQKRGIPEGSAEWEILYRKYYEEEMRTHLE